MTTKLTALQFALMDLIAHAEHNPTNGATPTSADDVNTWFWADELAAQMGVTEQAIGGIVTSLTEAGLIDLNIVSAADKKRHGDDSSVSFTKRGFSAWRTARQDAEATEAAAQEPVAEHKLSLEEAVGPALAADVRAAKKTAAKTAAALSAKADKKAAGGTTAKDEDAIVTVLVDANPKKAGTAAHARFALYTSGMTVAAFLAAGGTRADLRHDQTHGFVKVA